MSTFNNTGVTLKGAGIIASLVAGSTLTFTRIVVGDGVLPSGQSVLTTEKLVNPLFDVPISAVESDSVAHATVKGTFNNASLDVGFFYREIGLYAINPITKAEELFCYGNAGNNAEWINPVGESSLIEKEIHLVTLIGNATTVTATFSPEAPLLKSEFDAKMPLKADLDATPENGGRVIAEQMRFDQEQILYVDAAAADGGDGSEAKPFKTIAAAIARYYRGASVVKVRIAPGNYAEDIVPPQSPGTAWTFERNGSGTVNVKAVNIDVCQYTRVENLTCTPASGAAGIRLVNVGTAQILSNVINATGTDNGIIVSRSRARIVGNTVNNAANAVYANDGAEALVMNNAGTGNAVGYFADGALMYCNNNTLIATTLFKREYGGAFNPATWQQISDMKTVVTTLQSGIYSIKNGRTEQGLPGNFDGTLIVDQSTGAPHLIYYYDIENRIFHRFYNVLGGGWNDWQEYTPQQATAATYGLLRVASTTDEIDCQCDDAAVTPENLYKLANYRLVSTSYKVDDTVAVPYHADLQLKCTTAGTTSSGALDTSSVKAGQTLTDGGVTWKVIKVDHEIVPIESGGTGATTASQACANIGALPTSGGTITDFLTIKKSDKTGEPSIIFESNGGKKYSFYGSDDGIGIWDITNQKLATLIGNITGTARNGVAEFFWHQAINGGFYIRFNNGLILIAGYSIGYTGTSVTFPKAFSGGCSGVIACLNADETTADPTQLAVGNFSATGFKFYHKASIVMGIRYLAWGWA